MRTAWIGRAPNPEWLPLPRTAADDANESNVYFCQSQAGFPDSRSPEVGHVRAGILFESASPDSLRQAKGSWFFQPGQMLREGRGVVWAALWPAMEVRAVVF